MSSVYTIWFTIEEEDEAGDTVAVHDEGSAGPFHTLEEAQDYSDKLSPLELLPADKLMQADEVADLERALGHMMDGYSPENLTMQSYYREAELLLGLRPTKG